MKKLISLSFIIILTTLYGCTSAISPQIKQGIDKNLRFGLVQERPDAFIGKKVLWGGVILSTENNEDSSTIEVLQTSLDFTDRPKDIDRSKGRFLIEQNGFIDSAVYSQGKKITVAGEIIGTRKKNIDKLKYQYVVIKPLEMHLWKKIENPVAPFYPPYIYDPFYNPYLYDPFYTPYYPFFSPFYPYPPDWHPPHGNYPFWHPPDYHD